MATRIQLRRGLAADWASANPILAAGEVGVELDTGKFKIGDGGTAYTDLAYAGGGDVSLTKEDILATGLTPTDLGAEPTGTTANAIAALDLGSASTHAATDFDPAGAAADAEAASIPTSQKGVAGGVASLGDDGLVPAAQLPASSGEGNGGAWTTGSGPLGNPSNPVTDAAASRPSLTVVYWQTSTQPTNLAAGDIWIQYP